MKQLRHVAVLLLMPLMLLLTGCTAHQITRMSDRQEIGFDRMIDEIADARVILVGEIHDEKNDHDVQFDIIRTLHARGISLAIGLEMFAMDGQWQLDKWSDGAMDEQSFVHFYSRNWSLEWILYREIFLFARDHRIPLIALNIPRQLVNKVATQGFASLRPEEKKDLPPDVTCVLNTPYTEFLGRIYSQHALTGKTFTYFCEAQTLRNSGMAWNIDRYARSHPGKTIVTLAGAWHVVKNAIPEELTRYDDLPCKVILPELPGFDLRAVSSRLKRRCMRP